MWPSTVVAGAVGGKHAPQVPLAEDQDAVGEFGSGLWVPEIRRASCDLLILVDEPAEAVVSLDLVDLGWCAAGEWS
jgi:hypothetical protein